MSLTTNSLVSPADLDANSDNAINDHLMDQHYSTAPTKQPLHERPKMALSLDHHYNNQATTVYKPDSRNSSSSRQGYNI